MFTTICSNPEEMPAVDEVRDLYAAAAAEPPLSEATDAAALYAFVYASARQHDQVTVASMREERRLVAFCYGHPWRWTEQSYAWADQLRERLGDVADQLEESVSLNLLARDPRSRRRGLGRSVLQHWLHAMGGRPCWLATTDMPTPARRLYADLGFVTIGHGPDAPDGNPALILRRPADDGATAS